MRHGHFTRLQAPCQNCRAGLAAAEPEEKAGGEPSVRPRAPRREADGALGWMARGRTGGAIATVRGHLPPPVADPWSLEMPHASLMAMASA